MKTAWENKIEGQVRTIEEGIAWVQSLPPTGHPHEVSSAQDLKSSKTAMAAFSQSGKSQRSVQLSAEDRNTIKTTRKHVDLPECFERAVCSLEGGQSRGFDDLPAESLMHGGDKHANP